MSTLLSERLQPFTVNRARAPILFLSSRIAIVPCNSVARDISVRTTTDSLEMPATIHLPIEIIIEIVAVVGHGVDYDSAVVNATLSPLPRS